MIKVTYKTYPNEKQTMIVKSICAWVNSICNHDLDQNTIDSFLKDLKKNLPYVKGIYHRNPGELSAIGDPFNIYGEEYVDSIEINGELVWGK